MLRSVIIGALTAALAASAVVAQPAQERTRSQRVRIDGAAINNGCDADSYQLVVSPDGTSLSVLFDSFVVNGGQDIGRRCALTIPLNLPEGYSLGVYQVDYRGYAHLSQREAGLFTVSYTTGRNGQPRGFRHPMRGPQDGEFTFSDQLRPGMLRRIGCGEAARIDFNAMLAFRRAEASSEAVLALDSADGTRTPSGITFKFDLQPCRVRQAATG